MKKLSVVFMIFFFFALPCVSAETPQCVTDLVQTDYMKNADFSLIVKEISSEEIIYDYNINHSIVPASVLKIVTTATALEILGANYRFSTFLQYDGEIKDGVLDGNIYIKGGGDPTLGSGYFDSGAKFIDNWTEAIQQLGVKKITGSIIADESIFDNQGISPKWLVEDIGNDFAAGSYGINVFDNMYTVQIKTGGVGSRPVIQAVTPDISFNFNNSLVVSNDLSDASILGLPFSNERYLIGQLTANSVCELDGDISDPPLYLAGFFSNKLKNSGVTVEGTPSCGRIQNQIGKLLPKERRNITVTHSPPLSEIIKIINRQSHNLFADALLKTLGTLYPNQDETISSFEKGVRVLKNYWLEKKIDTSAISVYDGSGLSPINKVKASFICEILDFMANKSPFSEVFAASLPKAGVEGTVRNFLAGSSLQGKAMIKSGSMSLVRCYAGYVTQNGKTYIVCIFANNYSCSGREMSKAIEKTLLNLFPKSPV